MTGFIRGLFGRNGSEVGQPVGDYYLDSDAAKTLGDVQFMRKRTKIRRTFPKMGGATEGAEIIEEVSSMEKREIQEPEVPKSALGQSSFEPKKPELKQTGNTDNASGSMDYFRKLAKDINRR